MSSRVLVPLFSLTTAVRSITAAAAVSADKALAVNANKRSTMEGFCIDSADPLPLAVAILATHAAETATPLNPARLMQLLRDMWCGDARDVPSSIAFLRAYPTVFALDVAHRRPPPPLAARGSPAISAAATPATFLRGPSTSASASASATTPATASHRTLTTAMSTATVSANANATAGGYFTIDAVRLTAAATSRAADAATAATRRGGAQKPLTPGTWPPAAATLLSRYDVSLLPRTTTRPSAALWAPLLERILRERGEGATYRVSLHDLLAAVHAEAFARNLPFPPHAVVWFTLSSEPLYARIRAVWGEELGEGVNREALLSLNKSGVPKNVRRAAQLVAAQGGVSGENTIPLDQLKRALLNDHSAAARATANYCFKTSRMASVMVAVELLPLNGPTAYDTDIAILHELAAAIK